MQRYLLLIIGSTIAIVLDQITKIWAVSALAVPDGQLPANAHHIRTKVHTVFESWFNFKLAGNKGAAFGLFNGMSDSYRVLFFVIISLVAVAVIITLYRKADGEKLQRFALTMILGGAVGNLIDRIRLGYVIDFIDWHYGAKHWPTFNIADVAISVGVGLLLIDSFRPHHRKAAKEAADDAAQIEA
jgi:signal peptidase II